MLTYKTITLPFATLELHENYVISTINEGIAFDDDHLHQLFDVFNDYYADRPFVSIANRANDYTINPNLLTQTPHPLLLAIGVVCYTDASRDIALFESKFYKGNYEVFTNMKDCEDWAIFTLEEYIKNAGL
jgi:hypothetical protein